jgi:hypothetical protein
MIENQSQSGDTRGLRTGIIDIQKDMSRGKSNVE